MRDPYQVLGISPTATDDEVKKAYRNLAKRYHPDVNAGASDAEAKMKEINEAYSTIMRQRREGNAYGNAGGYGHYGGYGSYGYAGSTDDPQLRAARNYVSAQRFPEAMHVLEGIQERGAEWYFLSAAAHMGLGNRVAAINYANRAVSLDPNNFEYRSLLSRLQQSGQFYQDQGFTRGFGTPAVCCGDPVSCCMSQLLINMLCNCCCGFGRGC